MRMPRSCASYLLVDDEDELTPQVSVLADPVGFGGLLQREGLRDWHGEFPLLEQPRRLAERLEGALPTAAQPDAVLVSVVVRDGDHVVGAAGDLDQVGQRAAPCGVKSQVDAVRSDLADASHEAFAVGGRGRAERAQKVVVVLAGCANDRRAAGPGELGRRHTYPT